MDRAVEASGSGADVTQPSGDVRSAAATAVANPASKAVPRNDDESESAATETPNDPMFEKLKAALREVVLKNKREHCAGLLSELLKTDNPHVSKVFASAEIAWIAVTDDPDRGTQGNSCKGGASESKVAHSQKTISVAMAYWVISSHVLRKAERI